MKDELGAGLEVLECQGEECRPGPGCSREPGSVCKQATWIDGMIGKNQPTNQPSAFRGGADGF